MSSSNVSCGGILFAIGRNKPACAAKSAKSSNPFLTSLHSRLESLKSNAGEGASLTTQGDQCSVDKIRSGTTIIPPRAQSPEIVDNCKQVSANSADPKGTASVCFHSGTGQQFCPPPTSNECRDECHEMLSSMCKVISPVDFYTQEGDIKEGKAHEDTWSPRVTPPIRRTWRRRSLSPPRRTESTPPPAQRPFSGAPAQTLAAMPVLLRPPSRGGPAAPFRDPPVAHRAAPRTDPSAQDAARGPGPGEAAAPAPAHPAGHGGHGGANVDAVDMERMVRVLMEEHALQVAEEEEEEGGDAGKRSGNYCQNGSGPQSSRRPARAPPPPADDPFSPPPHRISRQPARRPANSPWQRRGLPSSGRRRRSQRTHSSKHRGAGSAGPPVLPP